MANHEGSEMNILRPLFELAIRYNMVLFPVPVEALSQVVPGLGFIVTSEIEPQFAARLSVAGVLAVKGDSRFIVDTQRQIIAVRGRDPKNVITDFEAIERLLEQEFAFSSEEHAAFYEVQMQAEITSAHRSPTKVFQELFHPLRSRKVLEPVENRRAMVYGVRLVPDGELPNSRTWFDIRIEPSVFRPDDVYYAHAVFRDPVRASVLTLARRGFDVVGDVIDNLEEGG